MSKALYTYNTSQYTSNVQKLAVFLQSRDMSQYYSLNSPFVRCGPVGTLNLNYHYF